MSLCFYFVVVFFCSCYSSWQCLQVYDIYGQLQKSFDSWPCEGCIWRLLLFNYVCFMIQIWQFVQVGPAAIREAVTSTLPLTTQQEEPMAATKQRLNAIVVSQYHCDRSALALQCRMSYWMQLVQPGTLLYIPFLPSKNVTLLIVFEAHQCCPMCLPSFSDILICKLQGTMAALQGVQALNYQLLTT